jgi:hypothetical protein
MGCGGGVESCPMQIKKILNNYVGKREERDGETEGRETIRRYLT